MKVKTVTFDQLPINAEYTCYGQRYRKIGETLALNLDTLIECNWGKAQVVEKTFTRPEKRPMVIRIDKNESP